MRVDGRIYQAMSSGSDRYIRLVRAMGSYWYDFLSPINLQMAIHEMLLTYTSPGDYEGFSRGFCCSHETIRARIGDTYCGNCANEGENEMEKGSTRVKGDERESPLSNITTVQTNQLTKQRVNQSTN